jgi:hypothetical protein
MLLLEKQISSKKEEVKSLSVPVFILAKEIKSETSTHLCRTPEIISKLCVSLTVGKPLTF